ncbi:D-aminoacyl-tRNA deacylase [hydrothermal vent metagenome]|uniref:D-aminoacyl-tRNA deacylase n=1 Tax=hydrothermal vent metagenome TaxID=652676 RepID=A0A3B1D9A8_9ZZZZ
MIAVIQRVSQAQVMVEGEVVAMIGKGLLILLGVERGDGAKEIKYLAEKIVNLRIFDNDQGQFDLSLADIEGAALIVSQFTLLGAWQKGRRPSYTAAAPPEIAAPLVGQFVEEIENLSIPTETGIFGAHMEVSLINDGPVTFTLDTAHLK